MKHRHAKTSISHPNRCPKCRGYIGHGGIRFGRAVKDISSCLNCGLSSESDSFYDALNKQRVEISGPVRPYRRDHAPSL